MVGKVSAEVRLHDMDKAPGSARALPAGDTEMEWIALSSRPTMRWTCRQERMYENLGLATSDYTA